MLCMKPCEAKRENKLKGYRINNPTKVQDTHVDKMEDHVVCGFLRGHHLNLRHGRGWNQASQSNKRIA
jgi:hypothetical protein